MGEPSESFSAAKDVYALGTVLLEVGEWRSLKSPGRESHRCEQTRRTDNLTRKSKPFLLDASSKGWGSEDASFSNGRNIRQRHGNDAEW